MRIRWKLLLLLLAIALMPLAVALWLGRTEAIRTAEGIAGKTRALLIANAEQFLLQTVRDNGRLLQARAFFLEQNVRFQARAVAEFLAEPPPVDAPVTFMREVPGQTIPASQPGTASDAFDHLAFYLPPGVARDVVGDDLARLTRVLPTYQLVRGASPDALLWQFTSTPEGIHCFYPGDGWLPSTYDPRQRPWFREAVQSGRLTWSPPLKDAGTQEVVLTIAVPIHRADGALRAVTAIDVRMSKTVSGVELPEPWRDYARTMIVFADPTADGGGAIRIWAKQDYQSDKTWDVPLDYETLVVDEEDAFRRVFADLRDGRAAVHQVRYEGRDTMWACGPLTGTDWSLLVILPHDVVLARALDADRYLRTVIDGQKRWIATLLVAVIAVIVALAITASRYVTRPIGALAAAAQRISAGDLDTPVHVRSRDELGGLADLVNEMLPQLRDRLRMREGLAVAMAVQRGLLPERPPVVPGWDVAGVCQFSDETGGDYYDYVDLSHDRPGRLAIAIGDVTGHGIGAALMMATVRALLRGGMHDAASLGDLLTRTNQRLLEPATASFQLMTLCCLVCDSTEHFVRWANAGHDPPLLFDPADGRCTELEGGDVPLGVQSGVTYSEFGPCPLRPGQILVVGTDGIWEARNEREEFFGKERLRDVVAASAGDSAADICKAVTEAVAAFRGTCRQQDDLTFVVVKALPGGAEA